MQQADDFLAESQVLESVVADGAAANGAAFFGQVTGFKGWTVEDVLLHLHFFNRLAVLALTQPEQFRVEYEAFVEHRAAGLDFPAATREMVPHMKGAMLLDAWAAGSGMVALHYGRADPKSRVPWAGPDMSARSSVTARLMETWAHGQAIYDLLGLERVDHDRIRNIAHLGVATYGWTYQNRGLPVPEPVPYVRLTAPSGAIWDWGEVSASDCIQGTATAFCQVVTQTRNVADTGLSVTGPNAIAWMDKAQCFAGPPNDPPPPGARGRG